MEKQETGADEPGGQKNPIGHIEIDDGVVQNDPGGHGNKYPDKAGQYDPDGHIDADVAPDTQYVPAAQGLLKLNLPITL